MHILTVHLLAPNQDGLDYTNISAGKVDKAHLNSRGFGQAMQADREVQHEESAPPLERLLRTFEMSISGRSTRRVLMLGGANGGRPWLSASRMLCKWSHILS